MPFFSFAYRRRQNYHEAGHFLVGHLLGLEVDEFNTASANGAGAQVTFVSTFMPGQRTHEVLDPLAVLSMAGVAAEVISCGDAEGGYTDVAQLRGLMELASPAIKDGPQQDDRITHVLHLSGDASYLSPHLLDLRDFLVFAALASLLEDGAAQVGGALNARLRRVDHRSPRWRSALKDVLTLLRSKPRRSKSWPWGFPIWGKG